MSRLSPEELNQRIEVAKTCESWSELFRKLGLTYSTSTKKSYQKHGINFPPVDRTKVDWEERKRIALTCYTWTEYCKKVGLPVYGSSYSSSKKHGVKISCFKCHNKPAVKTGYVNILLHSFCQECFDELHNKGAVYLSGEKRRSLSSRLAFMSVDKVPEAIACSIAHQSEIDLHKILKQIDEFQQDIDDCECSIVLPCTDCYQRYRYITKLKDDAKKVQANMFDANNPLTDPAFIQKVFDYKEP
jgi:hypothetical protein